LQSQHISGQGMFCNHLVFFTKLQPHQAKTKLVTPSFFIKLCNQTDKVRVPFFLQHT
jgi:hypothetical protein